MTRRPHSHINAELNRAFGERSIDQATVNTLSERLVILDRWIEDA
jgi:hypothetical protein